MNKEEVVEKQAKFRTNKINVPHKQAIARITKVINNAIKFVTKNGQGEVQN